MREHGYGKDMDCMNLSSIWTRLIKESAQCDAYSSDILIHYDALKRKLEYVPIEGKTVSEYFGFRDYGVDHDAFIECRMPYEYRKIYKLTVNIGEIENYEGYRDWTAELTDISNENAEVILKMIEEDKK